MQVSICGNVLTIGSTAWCRDWSAGRTSLLQPTKITGTEMPRRRSSGSQWEDTLRKVWGLSMLKHSTMTLASLHVDSKACLSSGRELVSTITTGTPSGVVSPGSLEGGSTGGGCSGKVSVDAAVISEVFPTPESPMTAMYTVLSFSDIISGSTRPAGKRAALKASKYNNIITDGGVQTKKSSLKPQPSFLARPTSRS